MILSLHVREDDECAAHSDDLQLARSRMQALDKLQTLLQGVLAGEAGVWLRRALASLPLRRGAHCAAFENLLGNAAASCRSLDAEGVTEEPVARQVVRLVCEEHARGVAQLLGRDGSLLRRFFHGNHTRIMGWFASFAGGEHSEHQLGARALARFAFVHRETCWDQLEWQGSHSQAPATVAAKPHYFRELDVVRTVENFIACVPAFWTSDELWDEVLRDGSLISLDVDFFVKELLWRMFNDNSFESWQLVRDFVANESFSLLCSRILHLVKDRELLMFVNDLADNRDGIGEVRGKNGSTSRTWLELAVLEGVRWDSLDDLSVGIACSSNCRQLCRLMEDDDCKEQAELVKQVLGGLKQDCEGSVHGHWALRRELMNLQESMAWKWLALEAWLLYCQLEAQEELALQKLLTEIGIICKTQNSEEPYREPYDKRRRKRITSGGARKRKKSPPLLEIDYEASSTFEKLATWKLSIDDFTLVWTKEDVADYLTTRTLESWLRLTGLVRGRA